MNNDIYKIIEDKISLLREVYHSNEGYIALATIYGDRYYGAIREERVEAFKYLNYKIHKGSRKSIAETAAIVSVLISASWDESKDGCLNIPTVESCLENYKAAKKLLKKRVPIKYGDLILYKEDWTIPLP